jgi:hypothetical protein
METLSKIRVGVFVMCGLVAALSVVLFVAGAIPLWALLAALFFPLAVLLSALLWLCLFTLIGDGLKSKNPSSCQNCVWGKARDIAGHCMGETMGYKYGEPCEQYERDML